jgi:hypothetical protein
VQQVAEGLAHHDLLTDRNREAVDSGLVDAELGLSVAARDPLEDLEGGENVLRPLRAGQRIERQLELGLEGLGRKTEWLKEGVR